MKKIDMAKAIGFADEAFVAEAAPKATRTKSIFWRKFAIVADCISLVLASASLWLFLPLNQEVQLPDIADHENLPEDLKKYSDSEYLDLIYAMYKYDKANTRVPNNNYEKYVEEFFDSIDFSFANKDDFLYFGVADEEVMMPTYDASPMPEYGGPTKGPTSNAGGNGGYVETTDNQVDGVIEADLLKRTKTHIFYLDPVKLMIRVYSIAGEESCLVATYDLRNKGEEEYIHAYNIQMFLSEDGNTLTVIGNRNEVGIYTNDGEAKKHYPAIVRVISLDVSNPENIGERSSFAITGSFSTARFVEGKILLMSEFNTFGKDYSDINDFVPHIDTGDGFKPIPAEDIIFPKDVSSKTYTVVTQLDGETLDCEGAIACLGYSKDIYVSKDKIVLCRAFRDFVERDDNGTKVIDRANRTEIFVLGYGKGGFEQLGSVTVDGSVKNQYSIDEYEGILRVVTTTGGDTRYLADKFLITDDGLYYGSENTVVETRDTPTNAALFCIDLSTFTIAAEVRDFAPAGETVESVRFDGTNAYVCTAVVITLTDPVYFFDLSNLSNITYTDTGVIEGYSSSLVDFGDGILLGIGYGANRSTLKIEVYAENGSAVESIAEFTSENVDFSTDYKSYFIDRERGLVGLMVYYHDLELSKPIYLLLHFNGYELINIATVKYDDYLSPAYARAALADGYFYVVCQDEFEAVKLFD